MYLILLMFMKHLLCVQLFGDLAVNKIDMVTTFK